MYCLFFYAGPGRYQSYFGELWEPSRGPNGFLINLGEAEYLVVPRLRCLSVWMVTGSRPARCQALLLAATIRISDAEIFLMLLNLAKDQSELTMCTDVDRNESHAFVSPARCVSLDAGKLKCTRGSIHTADHVEGHLRPEVPRIRRLSRPHLGRNRDRCTKSLGHAIH